MSHHAFPSSTEGNCRACLCPAQVWDTPLSVVSFVGRGQGIRDHKTQACAEHFPVDSH